MRSVPADALTDPCGDSMWHRRRGREDETARVICARREKSRDNAGDEAAQHDPEESRQGVAPLVHLGLRLRNGSASKRFQPSKNIPCVCSWANDAIPFLAYQDAVTCLSRQVALAKLLDQSVTRRSALRK